MTPKTWIKAPCCAAAWLALAVPCGAAPVAVWTGGAGSPNWSAAANWSLLRAVADGDGVVFDAPAGATTLADLSVRLDSLTFAAGAGLFAVHVAGSGGRTLRFDGPGIVNLTSTAGPIRQSLTADAGDTGASIVFAGASGINLGADTSFRPVDLLARGAGVAGQVGGRVVFQDQSTTGVNTFNALRAEGAGAAGAGAGELVFRDSSAVGASTTLTLAGGNGAGAAGGQGSFADGTRMDGIVNVLSGTVFGSAGGRAVFAGSAVAGLRSTLNNQGAQAGPGSEGVTEFRATARLAGSVFNTAAAAAGANGGRVEFRDQSAFDSTGYDGSLGSVQVINQAGSVAGAGGGSVVFRDDSAVRGSFLVIANQGNFEGSPTGTLGGRTTFTDRARAGALTIYNEAGPGLPGAGQTSFDGFANADHATITNTAGEIAGASGGATKFAGHAGAGSATLSNGSSASGNGGRGATAFADASSAQNATIDNQGGLSLINGFTTFAQSSTAGNATITNSGGRAAGAGGGLTQFTDSATAGSATLTMAGGSAGGASGGQVAFFGGATAGSATLALRGASVAGAAGGQARFQQTASAGNSSITIEASQVNAPGGPEGAVVVFNGSATAASATVVIGGNRQNFGTPGRLRFEEAATAANATLTTQAGYNLGGQVSFEGTALATASAGNARITNGSRANASGSNGDFGGATSFLAHSTADHAVILNEAGRTAFGAQTVFRGDSTAAHAAVTNAGGLAGDRGGITFFQDTASAGRSAIVNRAGALNATGMTRFAGASTAAQATVTSSGAATNAGLGGWTMFSDRATAGQSTLIAEGGRDGGTGGRIAFENQATGGAASVVLQAGSGANGARAGGTLDISAVDTWLAVGSIEGGGRVNLGARSLIVSGPAATTFSGVISGGTPAVFPSLTVQGALTLTGANVYAGRTSIGDGLNAGSGKLVVANTAGSATGSGEVQVQRGGTLSGSGFIDGPVTLMDGGVIAPGDPVTLTLRDRLTWNGGGIVRLVLGADSAGSDHLNVGSLIRGTAGRYVLDFVDAGVTLGARYDVLSFGALTGFAPADFEARGFQGTFAFDDGTLGFTAAARIPAVPEPASQVLMLLGLALAGAWSSQRTRWAASAARSCSA